MTAPAAHVPVLIDAVMASLAIRPDETHVDGTFGAGGYSRAMLAQGARVIAFDRDPISIREGQALAEESGERLTLVPDRFSRMRQALTARGIDTVDGVALDIGVSSMQLDRPERGFSFQADGPLDMRMDQAGPTAADWLNKAEESEIAGVIFRYGEEPKSRRIARAIVVGRPIERTGQLAEIVRRAAGYRAGAKKDPAAQVFQAIRIHLNEELDELEGGLEAAEDVLKPGGRLAVVTFHSLEDRLVKNFLRERSGAAPAGSRHRPAPSAPSLRPSFEAVAKPVRPSAEEVRVNPRARSATLRVARRTAAPSWSQSKRGMLS
jgi:16S rRNA (cytosine1402-N4)-methyltransferase